MATMGNWGQGPWFDPDTPDTPDTSDVPDPQAPADPADPADPAGPADPQSQPPVQRRSGGPVQRRSTGGPAQAPVPGPAARRGEPSRPLAQGDPLGQVSQWGQWGTPQGFADDFGPPAPPASGNETSSGPGNSGSHWTPPWTQMPVQPGGALPNPNAGSSTSAPASPARPPLPHPLTPPLGGGYSAIPPRRGSRDGNGRDGRDGRRPSRAALLPILLGVVALLVICSLALVFTDPLHYFGGQMAQQPTVSATATSPDTGDTPTSSPSPDASPTTSGTGTATPGPAATATPIPPPTGATVSFHPTTKQLTSAGSMTSCPSGCNLVGKAYTNSMVFSHSMPATQISQSALQGTIHAVNTGTITWTATSYSFTGGGWSCAPLSISLPALQFNDYPCLIGVSSPSSLPAHTIEGTASASPRVLYTQPNPLVGNGYYKVTAADCSSALNYTENIQGVPWANGWWASQTVPPGWLVALSQPKITFTDLTCPQGQQQLTAFNFTASSKTHADDAAYDPVAAQALAASRLDSLLPSGYLWKTGSKTTCTPTITSVNINPSAHAVTLTCADFGTAYYNWTSSLQSALASKLSGHAKTSALSTCNTTVGVQANTCSISIQGGDGTVLPASASAIVIQPSSP